MTRRDRTGPTRPAPPPLATARAAWLSPKRFAVKRGGELLGRTDLAAVLRDRTGASGRLYTETAFYRYHPLFFRFRRALDSAGADLPAVVAELRALDLSLWSGAERVDATIDMISPWGRNVWVVHVNSADPRVVGPPPL